MPLWIFTLCLLPMQEAHGLRVDINQDNHRGDVLSPGWENWPVAEGKSATARFGKLAVTLRSTEGGRIQTAWWKPGFDYPARMASDGVVTVGTLEIVLQGLAPGRHSLATYHNWLSNPHGKISVVGPEGKVVVVHPTSQVKDNEACASAFLEFEVLKEKEIVVRLIPEKGGEVVLNGFEIDKADPNLRAKSAIPFDGDLHAVEKPNLSWRVGANALGHKVYLGESREAVFLANEKSTEFRGQVLQTTFSTASLSLDHRRPIFWRVDEVHANGVVRGEVWMFQIRRVAFAEAEGYGRFAIGGRAGKVIEVTNLNDSGPGSLRHAVESSGPRTVVFRTGGLIELKSKLIVRHPFLTIAGQTAPGDGICLKNFSFGLMDTHDVIIRHLRIRVGDESGITQDGTGARGCDHVLFDHCSISWSIDEGFSSREAKNLTVQRCLIAEALNLANHKKYQGTGKGHSFAGSISGNVGSFHHNLLAHCAGRNWSLAGGLDRTGKFLAGKLDIRNNVVYNWRDRTTDGGVRELNFVNNFYLPGPSTRVFSLLKPDPGDPQRGMRAFMEGNRVEGKTEWDMDNWKAYIGPVEGKELVHSPNPLFEPFVTTQSASEALVSVLSDVGANRPKLDPVDQRVLKDARQRTHQFTGTKGKLAGIIDSPKDAGGWPKYEQGTSPKDSDHDGIPDDWEKAQGLDPANNADGPSYRKDGFTNLERYINHLAIQPR